MGKALFQRSSLPILSLPLLVLSSSLFISVTVCIVLNYFFTLLFPLLRLLQSSSSSPFSPFSFPLNSSLFLRLDVCLHILILTSLSCALSFSSEMPKIRFLFAFTKSCLLLFPPPCMLFAPSTIFIFIPLEQPCPQPSQPSFLLAIPSLNIPQYLGMGWLRFWSKLWMFILDN